MGKDFDLPRHRLQGGGIGGVNIRRAGYKVAILPLHQEQQHRPVALCRQFGKLRQMPGAAGGRGVRELGEPPLPAEGDAFNLNEADFRTCCLRSGPAHQLEIKSRTAADLDLAADLVIAGKGGDPPVCERFGDNRIGMAGIDADQASVPGLAMGGLDMPGLDKGVLNRDGEERWARRRHGEFRQFPAEGQLTAAAPMIAEPANTAGFGQTQHGAGIGAMDDRLAAIREDHIGQEALVTAHQPGGDERCRVIQGQPSYDICMAADSPIEPRRGDGCNNPPFTASYPLFWEFVTMLPPFHCKLFRRPGSVARAAILPLVAILPLALAACAHDQKITVWTKPNLNEDQRAKDLSACRRYADQQMAGERGVQQDVEVMNGGTVSGIKPSLGQNLGAYGDAKRYDNLVNQCMTEAGYTAVK